MFRKKYLLQTQEKGYSGCYMIAILNALIYYDKPYIYSLDDPIWQYLVDKYHCRYGACLNMKKARKELGVKFRKISRDNIPFYLPSIISCWTKVGFHAALVIDCDGDIWTIVNYDGFRGDVVMKVNKNDIGFFPKKHNQDRHYFVELIKNDKSISDYDGKR